MGLSSCDLEIWWMTLKNNRSPLLYYVQLCASFESNGWIQIGVTVRKCPIWVKIDDFFSHVTLKFDRWPWKTIGHLSLCIISSPYVNSNWSYSSEMERWVLTFVTLTFDLWPWPFAWTSCLSMVITPENFSVLWWHEHGQKGVTDGRKDGQTDRQTDGRK